MKKQMTKQLKTVTLQGIAFLYLSTYGITAFSQTFDWVKRIGGNHTENSFRAVATDNSGNVVIAGHMQSDTIDLNNGNSNGMIPLPGGNQADNSGIGGFVAKYDAAGNFLWGNLTDKAQTGAVATDADDNIFITGWFQTPSIDFNPGGANGMLYNTGGSSARVTFIVKYDADGNFQWVRGITGFSAQGVGGPTVFTYSICTDADGHVFVTGKFNGASIDFSGAGSLTRQGGIDTYVAKYDSDGLFQWARNWGGIGSAGNVAAEGKDVATDVDGNVYVTGYIFGNSGSSIDFNPGGNGGILNLVTTGVTGQPADGYIVKFDSSGNYVWARIFGGKNETRSVGLAVDHYGNVAVTGYFFDTVNFDIGKSNYVLINKDETCVQRPWALECRPDASMFVAKYDSSGAFLWVNRIRKSPNSETYGIKFDRVGNVYVAGRFKDTVNFNPQGNGNDTLTASTTNVFLLKYDQDGNYLWVKSARGDNSADEACGLAIHRDGSIYMAGTYQIDINATSTVLDFDNGNAAGQIANFPRINPNFGKTDLFLVKYICSDTSSRHISAEINCGESYLLGDSIYTAGGTYTQLFPNVAGCDSVVSLELTFIPLNKPLINVDSFTLGVTESYHSYQWLKNGEIIPDATDSIYYVTENADYQVAITNPFGCTDTSEIYNVNNVSINGPGNISRQIKVYPNPASNIVYIQSPVRTFVNITDMAGKVIKEQLTGNAGIPIAGLTKGIYLLHISDENGRLLKVEKLVKREQ